MEIERVGQKTETGHEKERNWNQIKNRGQQRAIRMRSSKWDWDEIIKMKSKEKYRQTRRERENGVRHVEKSESFFIFLVRTQWEREKSWTVKVKNFESYEKWEMKKGKVEPKLH